MRKATRRMTFTSKWFSPDGRLEKDGWWRCFEGCAVRVLEWFFFTRGALWEKALRCHTYAMISAHKSGESVGRTITFGFKTCACPSGASCVRLCGESCGKLSHVCVRVRACDLWILMFRVWMCWSTRIPQILCWIKHVHRKEQLQLHTRTKPLSPEHHH